MPSKKFRSCKILVFDVFNDDFHLKANSSKGNVSVKFFNEGIPELSICKYLVQSSWLRYNYYIILIFVDLCSFENKQPFPLKLIIVLRPQTNLAKFLPFFPGQMDFTQSLFFC